jgi:hypothetical protein
VGLRIAKTKEMAKGELRIADCEKFSPFAIRYSPFFFSPLDIRHSPFSSSHFRGGSYIRAPVVVLSTSGK